MLLGFPIAILRHLSISLATPFDNFSPEPSLSSLDFSPRRLSPLPLAGGRHSLSLSLLSALNAVAGASSENLPMTCVYGGPNFNDYATNRILQHAVVLPYFLPELRWFQAVTCFQVKKFDWNLDLCLWVFVEFWCNILNYRITFTVF